MTELFLRRSILRLQSFAFVSAVTWIGAAGWLGQTTAQAQSSTPTTEMSGDSHEGHDHAHGDEGSSSLSQEKVLRDDEQEIEKMIGNLPDDIAAEAREVRQRFRATEQELKKEMFALREIQLRYRNGFDQTPAAILKYREQRNRVWDLLHDQFANALDLIRYVPSTEAGSYVVTMVQNHFENSIYDSSTFEGAARMLELGQNLRYLYLAAARAGMATGKFETSRKIYEALKDSDLEDVDRMLMATSQTIMDQYEHEQKQIEAVDADSLPQVRFETTQGAFVMELFPESAPSAVAHFLKLVKEGFYDGLDFSQVMADTLALTGDPSNDGRGNSGQFLIDEHGKDKSRHALRGSVIMAKIPIGSGKFIENSASSQFAITFLPLAAASKDQSIIGRVIEGMRNVCSLRRVDPSKEKKKNEVQLPPDSIISAEVIREGTFQLPDPQYVDVMAELKKAEDAGLIKRRAASPTDQPAAQ